jgi:hypothetical protein
MKHWIVATLLTGLMVVPMMLRKHMIHLQPAATDDDNKRYDIEEYIADEEL